MVMNNSGISLEQIQEGIRLLKEAPPVPKEIRIMVGEILPEGTIIVSKDVWEALKKGTLDGKDLPTRPEAQL